MKDFLNSWLFVFILWAIIIAAYIAYKDDLRTWFLTPLNNATVGDIAIMVVYATAYLGITKTKR